MIVTVPVKITIGKFFRQRSNLPFDIFDLKIFIRSYLVCDDDVGGNRCIVDEEKQILSVVETSRRVEG